MVALQKSKSCGSGRPADKIIMSDGGDDERAIKHPRLFLCMTQTFQIVLFAHCINTQQTKSRAAARPASSSISSAGRQEIIVIHHIQTIFFLFVYFPGVVKSWAQSTSS